MRASARLVAGILAVVPLVGGAASPDPALPSASLTLPLQDPLLLARTKGAPDAPVTVYEMSDFQCPYCRTFALTTLPVLEREYVATGKVRFVFINFPLTSVHANAVAAAEVAMCAARQNKFWVMHQLLFERQEVWAPQEQPGPYLVALGDSAGLDPGQLLQCLTTKVTRPIVEGDAQRAAEAGARSTPTFYIEGGLLVGAAPVEVFRQVLDSVYRSKTGHPN